MTDSTGTKRKVIDDLSKCIGKDQLHESMAKEFPLITSKIPLFHDHIQNNFCGKIENREEWSKFIWMGSCTSNLKIMLYDLVIQFISFYLTKLQLSET